MIRYPLMTALLMAGLAMVSRGTAAQATANIDTHVHLHPLGLDAMPEGRRQQRGSLVPGDGVCVLGVRRPRTELDAVQPKTPHRRSARCSNASGKRRNRAGDSRPQSVGV